MGRTLAEWDRKDAGWLKNPLRKNRYVNREFTLTDNDVRAMLSEMDRMEPYTQMRPLEEDATKEDRKARAEAERLMRMRDKALVAIAWIFIKRGMEYLRLQVQNVLVGEKELNVTYQIQKKQKRKKICPDCEELNKLEAKFCSKCASDISEAEIIVVSAPSPRIVTKAKVHSYVFCEPFISWFEEVKRLNPKPESYIFPRFLVANESFSFQNHIGVNRLDQILQRIDPSMTSHFFRYGHTEVLLTLQYADSEVRTAGDWEKEDMVRTYGKKVKDKVGVRKYAEDTRMI